MECLADCGGTMGPCKKLCGEIGMCCKRGESENGCDGIIGGWARYECDHPPGNTIDSGRSKRNRGTTTCAN